MRVRAERGHELPDGGLVLTDEVEPLREHLDVEGFDVAAADCFSDNYLGVFTALSLDDGEAFVCRREDDGVVCVEHKLTLLKVRMVTNLLRRWASKNKDGYNHSTNFCTCQ